MHPGICMYVYVKQQPWACVIVQVLAELRGKKNKWWAISTGPLITQMREQTALHKAPDMKVLKYPADEQQIKYNTNDNKYPIRTSMLQRVHVDGTWPMSLLAELGLVLQRCSAALVFRMPILWMTELRGARCMSLPTCDLLPGAR